MYWSDQIHIAAALPPEKNSCTCLDIGWTSKPVWNVLETRKSLAFAGIRTPDSPARS